MSGERWMLLAGLSLAAAACRSSGSAGDQTSPTYYQDIQPIIQAKCEGCHTPQGIGPFSLQTADEVIAQKTLNRAAVAAGVMPPWPPAASCNRFAADRSLSATQVDTITQWVDQGAALGEVKTQKTASPTVGLSRIDLSIPMPEPFTPVLSPDDYRCFLLDWAPTTPQYVTGFGVLDKIAVINHLDEGFAADKVIVATILLPFTRRARGVGDG